MLKKYVKSKTKRIIIILIFLISGGVISQIIVSDPVNNKENQIQTAKMIEQLKEVQKQTNELSQMRENIKKNVDMIQEVNENIRNVERVRNIIDKQEKVYNIAFSIKDEFSGSDYLQVILRCEKMTNAVLLQTQANISELSKILGTGFFNMNDAERMESIRFYEEQTNRALTNLMAQRSLLQKYQNALNLSNANKFSVNDLKK